jgi:hypothetical protein
MAVTLAGGAVFVEMVRLERCSNMAKTACTSVRLQTILIIKDHSFFHRAQMLLVK